MKKVLTAAAAAAAVFAACMLGGCSAPAARGKFEGLRTAEDVYGFSAASAGMLISAMNEDEKETSGAEQSASVTENVTENDAENVTENDAENDVRDDETAVIGEYMRLVDSLLADGAFTTVSQTSDRDGYEEKLVVSYTDISGARNSYVMYYNQVLEEEETDGDEYEEEFGIDGVMIVDGDEYSVRGEKKNETDSDGFESELEFKVDLGDGRYMLVEQKYEEENEPGESETKQEYEYSVYDGARLTEKSSIEYEWENEDGEDKLEVKLLSYRDGKTEAFRFERERDGREDIIKVRAGGGRGERRYTVRLVDDGNGGTDYVIEESGRR